MRIGLNNGRGERRLTSPHGCGESRSCGWSLASFGELVCLLVRYAGMNVFCVRVIDVLYHINRRISLVFAVVQKRSDITERKWQSIKWISE